MKEAAPDTKGPDLAYLRQLAQAGQKVAAPRVIIPPVTLLSLLDRIEELEDLATNLMREKQQVLDLFEEMARGHE